MNSITIKKLLKITNELYEKEAQAFSDTRKEVWEKEIIDFVNKIEPGSSVLDLGCGNGRLFALLHSKRGSSGFNSGSTQIKYIGTDPSKKFIELNNKKYVICENQPLDPQESAPVFRIGDGLTMNFNNEFDYIISIAVLHHIPSEELQLKFLKNIYQALKPGGKILISTWNRLNDKYRNYFTKEYKQKVLYQFGLVPESFSDLQYNDLIVPWRQSGHFRFIHTFEPEELKLLAQKAGFKNIRILVSKHGVKTDLKSALNIYMIGEK